MKRAARAALLAVATAVAALGCNLILGNDEHELAQDASGGSGGAGGAGTIGGSGGQGGDTGQGGAAGSGAAGQGGSAGQGGAGQGGAGQGGAGQGGAAGQGATAGRGGAAGQGGTAGQGGSVGGTAGQGGVDRDAAISDGSAGTSNRDVATGGDADATSPDPDAPADVANDASCSTPGATECRGRSVFLCIGGIWVETQKCPYACVVNVCSGVCIPGATQCVGNTPQTCDATGTWQSGAICPFVCAQGACIGMCVPGTTVPCGDYATCNDGAVQTCDVNGVLGACNPAPSHCEIVPAGWLPVAKPLSSCPSGFGSEQTIYTSASGGAYTCTCGCGGTQACEGSVTLHESTSCASTVTTERSFAISNQCTLGNFGSVTNGYGYTLSDVVFQPSPDCFSNPTPTNQPPVQTTTATLCQPNLSCPTGACLSPAQAANLCVTKQGMEACPAGYPNGTTYAPWYDDTRSCGSCTCGSSLTCTLGSVLLDNNLNCAAGPNYYLYATTSCTTASTGNYGINYVQAKSTSSGSPACAETAPSTPMGTVELNQGTISTVCCK